jgi:hypothetical protein
MILDQTIGSARAEKHRATTLLVVCCLWTALMTSALAISSQAAWGMDSPSWVTAKTTDRLRLPPIPYLESTPWLRWSASAPTLKIDTLMTPTVTPWGILQTPEDRVQPKPALS